MSKSVEIDFTFTRPISVAATIQALLEAGMGYSRDGGVLYLVDEDGMFDWQKGVPSQLQEIIAKIGSAEWSDRTVGMTLYFPESDSGGDFLFHPGRDAISCIIGVNPRPMAESPRFCDIGWYLTRLLPPFDSIGLVEVETRDSL